jgi:pectinesterase
MKKVLALAIMFFMALSGYADKQKFDFIVAQDGSGMFKTIQEAINAVPDYRKVETRIFVSKGVYKEKVVLPESKQNITLIGENIDATIIQYDDYAQKKNKFGENMGTSGSSSFYVYGNDFRAENITFANTAGPVGQAVAMFVAGNRAIFLNCKFKGFQDTLYTYGKLSKQLYKNCYIEGTVDFIFGSSTAFFDNCHIHCLRKGYLTAASTPKGRDHGYVFRFCRITAEKEITEGIYLGRPWRPYAQTVFVGCTMGDFINPVGWHNWGRVENEKTAFYGEADNYDYDGNQIDLSQRVTWAHQVNIDDYTIEKVLADETKPNWFVVE